MIKKIAIYAFLFAAFLFVQLPLWADTIELAPQGEYAKIDVSLAQQSMQELTQSNEKVKAKRIAEILAAPDKYAPPVFYVLSNQLFDQGKKDEAAFWFYAGQLRARCDANRCADVTAREGVAVLNQEYGTGINQYMFQHVAALKELVPKVVEWDSKTPHNYDVRWINLHGMQAMQASLGGADQKAKPEPLSLPKSEWAQIEKDTRQQYLDGFNAMLSELNKRKH
ncbi:MAG: hypothetical protein K2W82_02735 [Candidatus Obscuribacterales bacterium]|nr:hypothetical protein [Candidatus Obscuribacterales bacterium]